MYGLVATAFLISRCQSVPDVAVLCHSGFFFNNSLQLCTQCNQACPPSSPIVHCQCSTHNDLICAACPSHTRYNNDLDSCVPKDMVQCPTTTSKECARDGICLRNSTTEEDFCVCTRRADNCDLIISNTIISDEVCFPDQSGVNFKTPSDIVEVKEDTTTRKANAALVGFIVAICCIGLVIISVFVILVVGIACHNRIIMCQHRRELHRLRRERRQREARRRGEVERRRLEENQRTSSEEQVAEMPTDQDNSAVHGNDDGAASQEQIANDEESINRDHSD